MTKAPKREQVSNACTSCRNSKLKCNGRHPACCRCLSKNLECVYDVSEGMTKRQHLNHELVGQKQELERAVAVLHVLQYGTDQEATASLARLRFGCTVEQEYYRLLPQLPEPGTFPTENVPQNQLPTPATERPDGPTPWGCSGGVYGEWMEVEPMSWTNPLSPVSQQSSTTAVSPYLDMKANTPGSTDVGDEPHSCIGG